MVPISMDNSITMYLLSELGEGLHSCGWFGGWITVESNGDGYDVMWCSGKYTHNPLFGSAISVEFFNNQIGWVFKSAISMWPVRDEDEQQNWAEWIKEKVSKAARGIAIPKLKNES